MLDERGMEALLLTKHPNFSWITAGGKNFVANCFDGGAVSILVTTAGARHRPGGDEAGGTGSSAVAAGDARGRCGDAAPDRTVFEITGRHSAPSHWGGAFVSFPGRVIPRSEATWESREAGFGFASAC